MKTLRTLAIAVLAAFLLEGACQAQLAGFSFSNATAGTNDPVALGGAPNPFDVWSDSGALIKATFSTQSPSTQFGVHDNSSGAAIADAPIAGNLVYGGRAGYPTTADGAGPAVLQINFATLLTGISFDFLSAAQGATGGSVSEDLALDFLLGNSVVASTTFTGGTTTNAASHYYFQNSGSYDLASGSFDAVRVSVNPVQGAMFGEFGIDNLVVKLAPAPAGVPEPGAAALLLGAGLPLVWRLRRSARC